MSYSEKDLAKADGKTRLKALLRSPSFVLALIFGMLAGGAAAWLSGSNDAAPRVVIYEQHLRDVENSLVKSQELFDKVLGSVGPLTEEQRQNVLEAHREIFFARELLKNAKPTFDFMLGAELISKANAQELNPIPSDLRDNTAFRQYLLIFIIGTITLFLLVCLRLYFTTTNEEKLKFADNMIRTIVGFYIGIVTGLLGIPPA